MPIDFSPGGSDVLDRSGNGKGVDINSDIADIDGAVVFVGDDSFTYLDLCGGSAVPFVGFIFLNSTNPIANCLFQVSVGSVTTINLVWRASATLDYDTGAAPTGTTGTDGRALLRAASDGRVYLENRLGAAIKVKMFGMNIVG
jgi:hypothetical protein